MGSCWVLHQGLGAERFPTLPVLSPCQSRARPQVPSRAGNLARRHGAAKSPACSSVSGLASVLLWGVQICSQSVCFADTTPRHTGNRYTDQEGAIVTGTFLTVALLCFIPSIHPQSPILLGPQPDLPISTGKPGVRSCFTQFVHPCALIWPSDFRADLWQAGIKSGCR